MARIRDGSVTVHIYPTPTRITKNGKTRVYRAWTVAWILAGRRQRKKFAVKSEAKEFADEQARKISNGQVDAQNLSPAELAAAGRAIGTANSLGKSLDLVLAEYEAAVKQLGDVSLSDAVRDYKRRHSFPAMSVGEAVEKFLAGRAGKGLDGEYLRNMRTRLEAFAGAFVCNLDAVSAPALQAWLDAIKGKLRTRNNYFGDVRALIAHAKRQRWLSRDWDETDRVDLARAGPGKIQPFTPEELEALLAHAQANPQWLPYLAIRAFAGVRAEEVCRLTEGHFHADVITIDADIAKTGMRRLVPILDALRPWLAKYPPKTGAVAPYAEKIMGSRLHRFIRAAGVRPRHNGLRDSYVSFRMAEPGASAGAVSQETGHGEAMLKRSYREIRLPDGRAITAAIAAKWFAVCPKASPKWRPR